MTRTFVILGFLLMFVAGATFGWRARGHSEHRAASHVNAPVEPSSAIPMPAPTTRPAEPPMPTRHEHGGPGPDGARAGNAGSPGFRGAPGDSGRGGGGGGWLATELNLSPEQHEQLRQIWSETMRRGRGDGEDPRRQLRTQRDTAIENLMTAEQKPQYDAVIKRYNDQIAELEQQWRSSYQNAIERTKQLLTPQQRSKYEEILSRQEWRGPGFGPRSPRGPEDRPPSRENPERPPRGPETQPY